MNRGVTWEDTRVLAAELQGAMDAAERRNELPRDAERWLALKDVQADVLSTACRALLAPEIFAPWEPEYSRAQQAADELPAVMDRARRVLGGAP